MIITITTVLFSLINKFHVHISKIFFLITISLAEMRYILQYLTIHSFKGFSIKMSLPQSI